MPVHLMPVFREGVPFPLPEIVKMKSQHVARENKKRKSVKQESTCMPDNKEVIRIFFYFRFFVVHLE